LIDPDPFKENLSLDCQPSQPLHYFCYMRFYILSLTFLLCISVAAQDTTNKWSLQKCVAYAISHNLTVKQADIQRMYADVDLHQSEMTKLPTLGGSLSGGYRFGLSENPSTGTLSSNNFFTLQGSLQTNYTIFNWFARKYNIESNKLNLQAAKAGIEKAQNDISLSVANTFLQAMLSNETVNVTALQLSQSQEQLKNTNALVKAGSVPELNSLQLQVQVANDSANLIQAESNYRQSIIQLKTLLHLPQDTAFSILIPSVEQIPMEPLADLEPKLVYSMALANQPLQRIDAIRLQEASAQVKAARGNMYPTIFAQAGLSSSYAAIPTKPVFGSTIKIDTSNSYVNTGSQNVPVLTPYREVISTSIVPFSKQVNNNFGQNIGVGISFNIFNQHQARTQWNRAKIQVQQYRIQQDIDNSSLQSDIYNAYELAVTALQKYNASVKQVEVNERALDLANKRNTAGLMNVLDLIITTNNLLTARIQMVRNRYDYIFKMKVLEFYKGNGIRL
jgi:outer membrane protein